VLDQITDDNHYLVMLYTGCFTTCGRYCTRWFLRSLWLKKKFI